MKKIAIFVEGMTEQEFVVGLISSMIGNRKFEFELARQFGGIVEISQKQPSESLEFYILVIDCCNDGQVKTQIIERYERLISSGYTAIFGLRDIYPSKKSEVPLIRKFLNAGIPVNKTTTIEIFLAEMEVEAWFIGEHSHFARLHNDLTIEFIEENGFGITTKPSDTWDHPASVLDSIYKLAKIRYTDNSGKKNKRRVQRTLRAISFNELNTNTRNRIPALNELITGIESALFQTP